jgi:hypothetical protein|tara:strand:- start:2153 stop:2533 length:381 start_codon:yes stop_codon:yes gene_type:complete
MIAILLLIVILYFLFGVDYNDKNIGSLGYKSKNFHMSHGMSNKIVDEMNKNGLSEDSIKEFIMMEDRFLELERRAVCSQTSRHFEAVGVSDQIKRRFLGYDFSYHAQHIKQASEPQKLINKNVLCS